MKKKNAIFITLGVACFAIVGASVYASTLKEHNVNVSAVENLYTLVLNNQNNPSIDGSGNATLNAKSDTGGEVVISYQGASERTSNRNHISLASGGTIRNELSSDGIIHEIKSITIVAANSGTVALQTSFDGTSFASATLASGVATFGSNGLLPSYFVVEATSQVEIKSISVSYNCGAGDPTLPSISSTGTYRGTYTYTDWNYGVEDVVISNVSVDIEAGKINFFMHNEGGTLDPLAIYPIEFSNPEYKLVENYNQPSNSEVFTLSSSYSQKTIAYNSSDNMVFVEFRGSLYVPCTSLAFVDSSDVSLSVGDSKTVEVSLSPTSTTESVVWTSTNETVAKVTKQTGNEKKANISAKAVGSAIITATCGTKSASINVIVSAAAVLPDALKNTTWTSGVDESGYDVVTITFSDREVNLVSGRMCSDDDCELDTVVNNGGVYTITYKDSSFDCFTGVSFVYTSSTDSLTVTCDDSGAFTWINSPCTKN